MTPTAPRKKKDKKQSNNRPSIQRDSTNNPEKKKTQKNTLAAGASASAGAGALRAAATLHLGWVQVKWCTWFLSSACSARQSAFVRMRWHLASGI
eukprot:gene1030-4265_t